MHSMLDSVHGLLERKGEGALLALALTMVHDLRTQRHNVQMGAYAASSLHSIQENAHIGAVYTLIVRQENCSSDSLIPLSRATLSH